jgi:hypothetical protein
MRRYRLFQAPIKAFFSRSFYREVGLHWQGTAFGYLLLLLTSCWVPLFMHYQSVISEFIENKAPQIISQVPEITITKGEVSVEVDQPYDITDPDTGRVLVVIDTTGGTTSLEDTQALALLTKTEVIFRRSDIETRIFSLKNVDNLIVDQHVVATWAEIVRSYAALVAFPFFVILSFLYRIVQALINAAIGLLLARWCKTSLSYQALLRLAVIAITPGIIVSTVLALLDIQIPFAGFFYFIVALAYLFLGIKAVSSEVKQVIGDDERNNFLSP